MLWSVGQGRGLGAGHHGIKLGLRYLATQAAYKSMYIADKFVYKICMKENNITDVWYTHQTSNYLNQADWKSIKTAMVVLDAVCHDLLGHKRKVFHTRRAVFLHLLFSNRILNFVVFRINYFFI